MSTAVIHDDSALLREAIDAESRQEQVEDARVVRVLGVLGVKLPVVRQYLNAAAENASRPVQHATNPAGDLRPEIAFEIGRVVAERPEYEAREFRDPQTRKVVLILAEFGWHAALPLDPALERDAGQLPGQIIGPPVVDAAELFHIAALRAAIDHRVDPAFVVSRDDDRGLANRRCDIIAWIGNLGCETEEIPGRALEDPLLLDLVLLGIGVEPERDLGEAVRRPRNSTHRLGAEL